MMTLARRVVWRGRREGNVQGMGKGVKNSGLGVGRKVLAEDAATTEAEFEGHMQVP